MPHRATPRAGRAPAPAPRRQTHRLARRPATNTVAHRSSRRPPQRRADFPRQRSSTSRSRKRSPTRCRSRCPPCTSAQIATPTALVTELVTAPQSASAEEVRWPPKPAAVAAVDLTHRAAAGCTPPPRCLHHRRLRQRPRRHLRLCGPTATYACGPTAADAARGHRAPLRAQRDELQRRHGAGAPLAARQGPYLHLMPSALKVTISTRHVAGRGGPACAVAPGHRPRGRQWVGC